MDKERLISELYFAAKEMLDSLEEGHDPRDLTELEEQAMFRLRAAVERFADANVNRSK